MIQLFLTVAGTDVIASCERKLFLWSDTKLNVNRCQLQRTVLWLSAAAAAAAAAADRISRTYTLETETGLITATRYASTLFYSQTRRRSIH